MSGIDYILFSNLERATSSDQNNESSIKDRGLLEMLRDFTATRALSGLGTFPVDTPRDVILGGLEVTPNGADTINVAPGTLLQENAALAPVPGPLDASYRYGSIRTGTSIAIAPPGVDSYTLIEAQMQEVVAVSTNVDVFNPGTGTFVPTLVNKQLERRIQFFQTTLAAQIPVPTAGRVPVAAVFRPAGGGAVLASQIIDLRPLAIERMVHGGLSLSATSAAISQGTTRIRTEALPGLPSELIRVSSVAVQRLGRELMFHTSNAIDPTGVIYAAGLTLVAETWRYLYLCPWRDSAAGNQDPTNAVSRGILVLSDVAPSSQGRNVNGAPIALPTIWNTTVATGDAICIGALRRNIANTGWFWSATNDRHVAIEQILATAFVPALGDNPIALATFVPANARTARVRVSWSGGAAGMVTIAAQPTGVVANYDAANVDNNFGQIVFEIPVEGPGTSFDLNFAGAAAPGLVIVTVIGWYQ